MSSLPANSGRGTRLHAHFAVESDQSVLHIPHTDTPHGVVEYPKNFALLAESQPSNMPVSCPKDLEIIHSKFAISGIRPQFAPSISRIWLFHCEACKHHFVCASWSHSYNKIRRAVFSPLHMRMPSCPRCKEPFRYSLPVTLRHQEYTYYDSTGEKFVIELGRKMIMAEKERTSKGWRRWVMKRLAGR